MCVRHHDFPFRMFVCIHILPSESHGVLFFTNKCCTSYYNLSCALISQEGVWVMQRADDYENIIFKSTWNELKKDDVFKKLFDIAGK